MLATLYTTAVDLPLHEGLWSLSVLWLVRMLCLFAFFQANCPCCSSNVCSLCSGDVPNSFQVITGGGANSGCSNCTNYNTTYIVDFHSPVGSAYSCVWVVPVTAHCSGGGGGGAYDEVLLGLGLSLGVVNIYVFIQPTNSDVGVYGDLFKWQQNMGTATIDAAALSSQNVGDVLMGSGNTFRCTHDGTTHAVVTAL